MAIKKMTIAKGVGLTFGAAFLVYWVGKLGPMTILNRILDLKAWSLAILANSFLWVLCYTTAWRAYFSNLTHKIPFFRLMKIKICGEAVNVMTPLNFMAGDPVRILLLEKQLGHHTRMGSVIVDRILHSLASVSFVLTGITIVFWTTELIPPVTQRILLGVYVIVVSFLGFVVIELVRGKGIKVFHPWLARLGISKRYPKFEEHLALLDVELSGFAGGRVSLFFEALTLHFMGRILGVVEIIIIFTYLTGHPYPLLALMLTALTSAINFVFAFIPGVLGVMESFYAGFFYFYGLDPSLGVTMQLIRRLRSAFWMGIGIFLLSRHKKNSPDFA
ncbi:MAG: flippase-like domain-containing protein [Deltaproteobacteria bacterium]|nr:flippase-like domain-containing protein [Deltaproteobacteria bacterium]